MKAIILTSVLIGTLAMSILAAPVAQAQLPQPQPNAPCNFFVVGPDQTSPGGVAAGPRLNPGEYFVWVSPRDENGKFSLWYPSGPYPVRSGDKYLVQVRDGGPPSVTWLPNDARLGQYPAPVGVGVPYYKNDSQRRIDYGFAVCAAPGKVVPPPSSNVQTQAPQPQPNAPCNFFVVGPDQSSPGGVAAGPRLNPGEYFVWVSPRDENGKFSLWYPSGPYPVRSGDKYLVQVRDGGPPSVTWLPNDARLGQYPAPVGVGVPYYKNDSQRRIDYGFAVCPAPGIGGGGGIVIGTSSGFRFGFSIPGGKRLTYSATGSTNTTVAKVDGLTAELGTISGKTVETEVKLEGGGVRATWVMSGVRFTQTLQPVASATGSRDAVLIRWTIRNEGTSVRAVGLRTQVDTLIGNNDGVPFMVPGRSDLVRTMADFPKDGPIPQFVQALENPDLQNPGTVAHITLKVRGVDPPDRVSLTHWPGTTTRWDIPVTPMGSDSAIVLYWDERPMQPGASREIGFSYGLGNVVSSEGRIGATTVASASSGSDFPISAYVKDPRPNETVTIEPPIGLSIRGPTTVAVPPPPPESKDRTSVVTWTATAAKPGNFDIAIRSSSGDLQRQTIEVVPGDDRPTPPIASEISVPSLIAELANADPAIRLKAAKMLGRMGVKAADAIEPLRTATTDVDEDVRRVAADSLRQIETAVASAPRNERLTRLIAELGDPDEVVRLQAAKELGKLGPAASEALPALERATRDADDDVRRVAAASIVRIRGTSGTTVPTPPPPTTVDPTTFRFRGASVPIRWTSNDTFETDLFNLTFAPGERVEVSFIGDGSTDLDLWVHDASEKVLVKEIGLTDKESAVFTAGANPHRVEVRNIGGTNNVYDLKIKAVQSAPNGFRPMIVRRTVLARETDVFSLPFEGGRTYRLQLKNDGPSAFSLIATTEDGREQAAELAAANMQSLILSPRSAGTIRIAVRNTSGQAGRYSLSIGDAER